MTFALDSATRRRLGYKLIDHIDAYFASLPERGVQLPESQRTFGRLDHPLPELGEDADKVLDDLCREMTAQGFHIASGNYFGLMNPAPAYMAVLGEALVAALNPQIATLARSQLASKIELETVRWVGERVYRPAESGNRNFDGTFTSGGNEANFSALAMALATHFPTYIQDGAQSLGARPVFYASAESHHSLDKSAGLLGIGRSAVRRIPVTDRLQMDVQLLERAIESDRAAGLKPFCVVGTAGTTNSGAVDDLIAMAEVCQREGLWFHVDGAFGAAAAFSDQHRHLVEGIERADSVTIDPHKWLSMPFAAGVILTKHPEALSRAFEVSTPYMPKAAQATLLDNFKVSSQWSRRVNSLKLWLTLRVHGRQAYEELIDRQLRLTREFAAWVDKSGAFEMVLPPQLTIVNFRVKGGRTEEETAALNVSVVDEVTRDGRRWISVTRAGRFQVIRAQVISYFTSEQNLEELKQALQTAAASLRVAR